jgi:phosphotransferase system HPr-like phosphotransfer protein
VAVFYFLFFERSEILTRYEGKILLNTIDKVKHFCEKVGPFTDADIHISSGRYVVDGKSIMGIFSLDLMKVLNVKMECENENTMRSLIPVVSEYLVER